MFEDLNNQDNNERANIWKDMFKPKTVIIIAVVLLFFLIRLAISLKLDWTWFDVLGYPAVFWRMLLSRFVIGGAVFLLAFILCLLNLFIIHRISRKKPLLLVILPIALLIALFVSINAGSSWMTALQAYNSFPFGINDPQFNLDIAFYVFRLPLLWLIYRIVSMFLIINLIAAVVFYIFYFSRGIEIVAKGLTTRVFTGSEKKGLTHIGFLLGLTVAWQAVQYKLSTYELLYSQTGSVIGAGATDIGAKLPIYVIMMGISLILGLFIAIFFSKRLKLALLSILVFFLAAVALTGIVPGLYQKFIVDPEELGRETPYLERNIKYTKLAYNLDKLTEVEYPVGDLTAEDLAENQDIIDNIRILDHRATRNTYGQQQEIRLYYDFADVDVDRYLVDGKLTQVFLSARELNQSSLSQQAMTFNNLMFKYTHGFGLVMSPTNKVTQQGMPSYLIQDIPPQSAHFNVNEPRIYFGEVTDNNVIVNTGLKEFDYPLGNDNAEYLYEGKKGIPMTFINKALLTIRDMQLKYLLSGYITSESQYLETRNVKDRVYRIAPFLRYDADPYLVLGEDGRLYYILDAYTASNRYPYSKAVDDAGIVNYLRNSVKATVDAYTGEVNFYITDRDDPLIRAYEGIFPGLFKDVGTMPQDLRSHIRYPEYLFNVQSLILRDYHMGNPTVFYNREDRWEFAQESYSGEKKAQESYYSIIRLPGEEKPEFIQMRVFTPTGKQNQVSWLAARSDGENYGKLLLYKFPKGVQVTGTLQVESIIDQDPEISSQLTLWGQGGSRVIRGNILIYPIAQSLLYVEPLYIESEQNKFPQLRKILVYYKDRVVMKDTLTEALSTLFGTLKPSPGQPQKEQPDGTIPGLPLDETERELIEKWISLHNEGKEKLKAGDLEGYGRIQKQIDDIVKAIEQK